MCVNVASELRGFVKPRRLGIVVGNDAGIILRRGPDRVRGGDVSFFAAGRLPEDRPPRGYAEVIPEFVAEVVSPWDTASEVEQKVQEWLAAGVRLVWVLYPATRSVTAYQGRDAVRVFGEADLIDGGPVFPGLAIPVGRFFTE